MIISISHCKVVQQHSDHIPIMESEEYLNLSKLPIINGEIPRWCLVITTSQSILIFCPRIFETMN